MLRHVLNFLIDYTAHINAKKIFGGTLTLLGFICISKIRTASDPNDAIAYALAGIVVGGVGLIVIYYDIAKDKLDSSRSELSMLAEAQKQKERQKTNASSWHMDQNPNNEANSKK
jgi:hypothetical protein